MGERCNRTAEVRGSIPLSSTIQNRNVLLYCMHRPFSHVRTQMKIMPNYANPANFLRLAKVLVPLSATLTALLLGVGLYLAWFVAPPDYQQGETVRIMYLHVPAAWLAMVIYVVMTSAALGPLVWRHPLADAAQKAAAALGASFTALCLGTGSLWGKPMWGAWWVWDARLTSVLVLFFLYLGYIALVNAFDDASRGAAAGALL